MEKRLTNAEIAARAAYLKGAMDALESIASKTGDQNTRALCQKERERYQARFNKEMDRLPV